MAMYCREGDKLNNGVLRLQKKNKQKLNEEQKKNQFQPISNGNVLLNFPYFNAEKV